MAGDGQMPKADTRHLYRRNGWWHLKFRIPNTQKTLRKSLHTQSLAEAQAKRDKLMSKREELVEKIDYNKTIIKLREKYLNTINDHIREEIRENIQDAVEDIAQAKGILEIYKGFENFDPDTLSDSDREPFDIYQWATGNLTPIKNVRDDFLARVTNKATRADYRRALSVLEKHFATIEEVDWGKADLFLQKITVEENVSAATVNKWKSGYVSLWKWLRKSSVCWQGHKVANPIGTAEVTRDAWTPKEVVHLYGVLCERNDKTASWLRHAVWIAAHTGARADAISLLSYNQDEETITFPKLKREKSDRVIPAHSEIRYNLISWENGSRRTQESISNRFSEFKKELGFSGQKVFHSLRNTFLTEAENVGIPEGIAADIVGHKKNTISYGLYSTGSRIPEMRHWIEKIRYR